MQSFIVNCCNSACSPWEWSLSGLYLISQYPKSPFLSILPPRCLRVLRQFISIWLEIAAPPQSQGPFRTFPSVADRHCGW